MCDLRSRYLAPTWCLAMAWYLVLMLCAVDTTSYQHLPTGSRILRDRLWVVMLLAAFGLGCALGWKRLRRRPRFKPSGAWPARSILLVVLAVTLVGILPATLKRAQGKRSGNHHGFIPLHPPIGAGPHYPGPPKPFQRPIIAAQLNARQGYGSDGFVNFEQLADFFNKYSPHIIALEETETQRPWAANRDMVEYLTWKLHLNSLYGLRSSRSTLGVALLTNLPILSSSIETMPSHGDLGLLLSARLEAFNNSDPLDMQVTSFCAFVCFVRSPNH